MVIAPPKAEIIYCKRCNNVKIIERSKENGLLSTFLKKVSQKFLGFDINVILGVPTFSKAKGVYWEEFGVCEDCVKKSDYNVIFEENHLLLRYMKNIQTLESKKEELKWTVVKHLDSYFDEAVLAEITPEAFEQLRTSKHYGLRREKRRLVLKYLMEVRETVVKYIYEQIEKDEEFLQLKTEIVQSESEIKDFLKKSKNNIDGYVLIDNRRERFLNSSKRKRLAQICPGKNITNSKFYRPIHYSKYEVQRIVDNTYKFKLNLDMREFIGNFCELVNEIVFGD